MIRKITREEAAAFPFSNDAEAITFHKMRQLLTASDALCLSDGKDLLFVRAGQGFPAWIYTRRGVSDELLNELAENRKLDGVEVFHYTADEQQQKQLLEIAEKHDLIVTGGSDFHGLYNSVPTHLGKYTTTKENLDRIIKLANKKA